MSRLIFGRKKYRNIWILLIISGVIILCLGMASILSGFTAIFILVTAFFVCLLLDFIRDSKKAKKILQSEKPCTAKLIDIKGIRGYKGSLTYTFEIEANNEIITIEKSDFKKKLEISNTLKVYPIYDDQNNIIDFEYDLESKAKVSSEFIIIPFILILLSVFFVLNDGTIAAERMIALLAGVICLVIGGFLIKCNRTSKKTELIPVYATIVNIEEKSVRGRSSSIIITKYYRSLCQANVDGQIYQFLGERLDGDKEQAYGMIGKVVQAYYEKETMIFYDNPRDINVMLELGVAAIACGIGCFVFVCSSFFM